MAAYHWAHDYVPFPDTRPMSMELNYNYYHDNCLLLVLVIGLINSIWHVTTLPQQSPNMFLGTFKEPPTDQHTSKIIHRLKWSDTCI